MIWFYIAIIMLVDIAQSKSNEVYHTKWPYPVKPKNTDWSDELKQRPSYHTSGHREIDAFFTEFLRILSRGDPKKKAMLTLYHEWFPMEAVNCLDRLRDVVSKLCVEWRWNPYAQKFSYILVNMCNAGWLQITDIEEAISNTCTGKRVTAEDLER